MTTKSDDVQNKALTIEMLHKMGAFTVDGKALDSTVLPPIFKVPDTGPAPLAPKLTMPPSPLPRIEALLRALCEHLGIDTRNI